MRNQIVQRLAEQLQDRRKRILLGVARLEDELRQCADERESELEDAAAEASEAQVLASLDERGRHEIEEIDQALLRIASGTYGQCNGCGEEISAARLAALPATPFCFSCASDAGLPERPR